MVTIPSVIRMRRGTTAEWSQFNPILRDGEMGSVTGGVDNGRMKIGDGVTRWNNLPFSIGGKGDPGITPSISVSAFIVPHSQDPSVHRYGSDEAPHFSFGIPRGATGADGDKFEPTPYPVYVGSMVDGATLPLSAQYTFSNARLSGRRSMLYEGTYRELSIEYVNNADLSVTLLSPKPAGETAFRIYIYGFSGQHSIIALQFRMI